MGAYRRKWQQEAGEKSHIDVLKRDIGLQSTNELQTAMLAARTEVMAYK